MLFNSYTFLVFLALFSVAYWSTRGRIRLWVMFASSLIFYGWWDWRFLGLLLFSAVLDFTLGIWLQDAISLRQRKSLIFASVAVNLGFLGFFKYFNFFADSGAKFMSALGVPLSYSALHVVLPVGISFYVFKTMSYTIDVYRGTQTAERDLLRYATFVVFFPELVAGPIVRASRMLPQLHEDKVFEYRRVLSGINLIMIGYVLKVVIADSLAPLVDARFARPDTHTSLSLLLGVYCYAFQIYGDFAGYSSIAIGLARMFGFDFGGNFRRPYFSRSFSEFWSRWHISLSSWLRDYLYIPLGGNRRGAFRTHVNLFITMLLGGLWHGAAWTFVLWGALHGTYLILQRLFGPPATRLADVLKVPHSVRSVLSVLLVFHLTCLAWVLFRAQSLQGAVAMMSGILTFDDMRYSAVDQRFLMSKALVLIAVLVVVEFWQHTHHSEARTPHDDPAAPPVPGKAWSLALSPAATLALAAASLWLMTFLGTFSGNSFIYFQF